jgi:hypothetical protein
MSAAVLFISFYLRSEYIDVLFNMTLRKGGGGEGEMKGKINIFQRFCPYYT